MKQTKKMVYVEWIDSCVTRGWQDLDSFRKDAAPDTIYSVGYLIQDEKDFITITTSISTFDNVLGPLTIPKCAIKKMKRIKA